MCDVNSRSSEISGNMRIEMRFISIPFGIGWHWHNIMVFPPDCSTGLFLLTWPCISLRSIELNGITRRPSGVSIALRSKTFCRAC
jgi:hypothetical protein